MISQAASLSGLEHPEMEATRTPRHMQTEVSRHLIGSSFWRVAGPLRLSPADTHEESRTPHLDRGTQCRLSSSVRVSSAFFLTTGSVVLRLISST
jgi:hypothetical protein